MLLSTLSPTDESDFHFLCSCHCTSCYSLSGPWHGFVLCGFPIDCPLTLLLASFKASAVLLLPPTIASSTSFSSRLNCVSSEHDLFIYSFLLLPYRLIFYPNLLLNVLPPVLESLTPSALPSPFAFSHLTPYFTAELRLISPGPPNNALYTAGARLITHN